MRTPISFGPAFYQPMPTHPTPTSKKKVLDTFRALTSRSKKKDLDVFRALDDIKDFVGNHSHDEQTKRDVRKNVDAFKARLRSADFNGSPVLKLIKDLLHELSSQLKDQKIPLQDRLNAVLEIYPRFQDCTNGIAGELGETVRKLKDCNGGVKAAVYKRKILMMEELIRQHVAAIHHPGSAMEIHYVLAYYNHFAERMGVKKRTDAAADDLMMKESITPANLERCRKKLQKNMTPTGLADDMGIEYRGRLETVFNENGIDENNIPPGNIKSLTDIQKAELAPRYGEVSPDVFLKPKDPNDTNSPYVYTGKEWPTGFGLHFLKDLKKKELVAYDKDSKSVLAKAGEGRIKMRENQLWFKEKGSRPEEPTLETWSTVDPGELFDNIKKIEPANIDARTALVRTIIKHVRNLPQTDGAEAIEARWLLHAREMDEVAIVDAMLEAEVEREARDSEGQTALMHAAGNNQLEPLKALLEAGADKEAKDNEGQTALMHAAGNNQLETLKALLEAGADKEAKDNEGRTAMMHVAVKKRPAILKALLEAGADKDAKDNGGRTFLMHVAGENRLDILKALLEAGADKEAKDNEGQTALMHAAGKNRLGTLNALLKAGTDKDAKDNGGRTALMHAAINGQALVLKALLKAGADRNARDNEGKTAQMHAVEQAARSGSGNAPALRVFLTEGAATRLRNSLFGTKKQGVDITAQEVDITAMLKAETVDLEALQALIDNGANLKVKSGSGKTPLMYAAKKGNVDSLRVLLESGADVNAQDNNGDTALMLAAMNLDVNAVRILLNNGADSYIRNHRGIHVKGLISHQCIQEQMHALPYSRERGEIELLLFNADFNRRRQP